MSKRTASIFPAIILVIILGGTVITDLYERKIYNIWLLPGLIAGLALRGIGFFLPVILIFFPVYFLFRIKLMGGGDGKVLMLIAGSLGFHDACIAIFLGFLIAAMGSVFYIVSPKGQRSLKDRIPLAACLAAGTVFFILIRIFIYIGGG